MATGERWGRPAHRPVVRGTRHMIAAGHYLAATAGLHVLEAGGNAVDAGVAAGITLGVVQTDLVSFAGVAPIIIYRAAEREVVVLNGLGGWPKAATVELFRREHGGQIPVGIRRTVVPAAPDAWITALQRYGTLSFGEVAGAAIQLARDGFPMHWFMADRIHDQAEAYRAWPSNAAIFLPSGRPPAPGEVFVQRDLARVLQYMADEEHASRRRGRDAGLDAARTAFYTGDIARRIVDYHHHHEGLLTAADLASFRTRIERSIAVPFGEYEIHGCGPWCQGPTLLQALRLLESFDLASAGHNTPSYLHAVTEALKLAFADREAFYGDPEFVDVPMEALLGKEYARERAALIRRDRAWPGMPPAGTPFRGATRRHGQPAGMPAALAPGGSPGDGGTSYVCVVDRHGNAFSATPSDVSFDTPIIPGTGLAISSRGSQSRVDPDHPAGLAPGKRPRLTPNPAIAFRRGRLFMPFGTPGGDVQCQAMLQVFLNVTLFGMDPQQAVEAPRVATWSFPSSNAPYPYLPGRLTVEAGIDPAVAAQLTGLGHDVAEWPRWVWKAGAVCAIVVDPETGVLSAGADPRRESYALGW
jgi:gamma-glutamyltranspeptidase/glutathione hydrolase